MSDTHVGVSDISKMFGVSRQRANTLVRRAGFPKAAIVTSGGRVWLRSEVAAWGETWDRASQGGRPRKPQATAP